MVQSRFRNRVIPKNLIHNLCTYSVSEFISPLCRCSSVPCVTLLAEYRYDSSFVEHQIRETQSYLNILWLGADFRRKVLWLYNLYATDAKRYGQLDFVLIHQTPSIHFENDIKMKEVILPHCEEYISLQETLCRYELSPIVKYYFKTRSYSSQSTDNLLHTLKHFYINDTSLLNLQKEWIDRLSKESANKKNTELVYNQAACSWLQKNENVASKWSRQEIVTLYIGGIFPVTDPSRGHKNLYQSVQMAVNAINRNNSVLANYKLDVQSNDGKCKADKVMEAFIYYFLNPRVLGVLGPACSETVEPIAGISKHTNIAVISYSAEGASFMDRKTYPHFFRTIGSNRQYEDAYISLMKRLGWRRVAALTEDGQKYTEYISHMEAAIKQNNMELIINKKFLSDVAWMEMNKVSAELMNYVCKCKFYSSNSI